MCPKCGGPLTDWLDGDLICLHCGKIVYATEPLPLGREVTLKGPTAKGARRRK